ncbi:MAG: histidine kinase [Acidimicrobiia bacterium]
MTSDMLAAAAIAVGWVLAGLFSLRAGAAGRMTLLVGVAAGAAVGAALGGADVAAAALSGATIGVVATLFASMPEMQLSSGGVRIFAVVVVIGGVLLGAATAPDPTATLALFGAVVSAIGLAVGARRARTAGDRQRRRVQWTYLALVIVADVAVVAGALDLLVDWPGNLVAVVGWASLVIPLSVAISTRPRAALRVDRALAATVVVSGLAVLVTVVLLVVVLGLGSEPKGRERTVLLLCLAGVAVAGLLAPAVLSRLRVTANRVAYGEQSDPVATLRTFGTRMTRALPLEELLQQLAELLHRHLRLTAAEVWTGTPGELQLVGAVPHRQPPPLRLTADEAAVVARAGVSGDAWLDIWLPDLVDPGDTSRVVPLAHAGELLGLVVCRRHLDADPLTESEEQVLADVARQVALAIHNSQLDSALQASLAELQTANSELRASRARIVVASDESRRHIERNLHDGAQQHLVALAVKVGLARKLLTVDPDTAGLMLEELREDVQTTLTELRELAHGIYPPLLRDRGLEEALRAACSRSALYTDLDCNVERRFSPDVEAAVYFCCLEALQNAGKHAGADAKVTVWVHDDGSSVRFEVVDDGAGFDVTVGGSGHGFVNMADRLGAIGGTLDVHSELGRGTSITGCVPDAPEAAVLA